MILNEKYLPNIKEIPKEMRKEYREGSIGKKKYLWTKLLMSRLDELKTTWMPWMNTKHSE